MLPAKAALEKLVGEIGIDEDSHVVIVPAGVSATDFGAAARIYWTLKAAGHPAVSILDGGFAAWQAAGYPVERGKIAPQPKIFTARLDGSLLAEVEAVERNSTRDAGRCAAGELLRRQGKGAGLQGLWPYPGRAQYRQRELLRSGDQPAAAQDRARRHRQSDSRRSGDRLLQHRSLGGD